MAKLLWVRSALPPEPDGGERWALWDVHPDHPADPDNPSRQHEVKVIGPKPVQVAATSRVLGALRDGTLEEVSGPHAAPREAASDSEPDDRKGRRQMGGKPSTATPKDGRLGANKPKPNPPPKTKGR